MSLAQCVLGLLLSGVAVPSGRARQAGVLLEMTSRINAVKILTLRMLAATGAPWLSGQVCFLAGPVSRVSCSPPR